DGRIDTVTDNVGRTLKFAWMVAPHDPQQHLLTGVSLTIASASTTFASFWYTPQWQLDRIDHASTYHRFFYLPVPPCQGCAILPDGAYLLTDVTVPAIAASTPAVKAAIQPNEIILEDHAFYDDPSQSFPRGKSTSGPARAFAYIYGAGATTQLDL